MNVICVPYILSFKMNNHDVYCMYILHFRINLGSYIYEKVGDLCFFNKLIIAHFILDVSCKINK